MDDRRFSVVGVYPKNGGDDAPHINDNPIEKVFLLHPNDKIQTRKGYVEIHEYLKIDNDFKHITSLIVSPGCIAKCEKPTRQGEIEYPIYVITLEKDEDNAYFNVNAPEFKSLLTNEGIRVVEQLFPYKEVVEEPRDPKSIAKFIPGLNSTSGTFISKNDVSKLKLFGHLPNSTTISGGYVYTPEIQDCVDFKTPSELIIEIETGNISLQDFFQKVTYMPGGCTLIRLVKAKKCRKILVTFELPREELPCFNDQFKGRNAEKVEALITKYKAKLVTAELEISDECRITAFPKIIHLPK